MADIGPDGHPIPEVQGVVNAVIQPILAKDINFGEAVVEAKGSALYLPNFVTPPTHDADGKLDPSTVECVPLTLEAARAAAVRVTAMIERLPLTESAVDLMNLAYAVLHYGNKE